MVGQHLNDTRETAQLRCHFLSRWCFSMPRNLESAFSVTELHLPKGKGEGSVERSDIEVLRFDCDTLFFLLCVYW